MAHRIQSASIGQRGCSPTMKNVQRLEALARSWHLGTGNGLRPSGPGSFTMRAWVRRRKLHVISIARIRLVRWRKPVLGHDAPNAPSKAQGDGLAASQVRGIPICRPRANASISASRISLKSCSPVSWFSQRITMGESEWAGAFERIKIARRWAYKRTAAAATP
jgi:hypothetical protein